MMTLSRAMASCVPVASTSAATLRSRTVRPQARRGRTALAVVGLLLVVSVASVVIVRTVRQEMASWPRPVQLASAPLAGPDAPPENGGQGTADDPAAVHSRLALVPAGAKARARTVVELGKPVDTDDFEGAIKGTLRGLLSRELFRQAWLVAARDELGLPTRDELLGDAFTDRPADHGLELVTIFRQGDLCRVTIRQTAGKAPKVLLDRKVPDVSPDELVKLTETLSRADFPKVLRALHAEGKANPQRDEAAVPEEAIRGQQRLGFSDQLAAIRDLHAAIRADGESPARLAALARGYALLGVLSEYQWHSAHKAYKARALLYAQRLSARDPEQPLALWNRAFVWALVGQHALARNDLDEAQKQVEAHRDAAAPQPAWVGLIDAYLRYDTPKIQADQPDLKSLAALLRLLAQEFPWLQTRTLPAARDVLSLEPDCFRAADVLCDAGGLGDLHVATVQAPMVLDRLVPKKLLALESLPKPAREAIERQAGEPVLVEALERSAGPEDDAGEPSWAALAHLISEARFVHVQRRLSFMRNKWSVPVGEYWAENHLSVARHRFRPYLESLALPPDEAGQALADLVDKVDVSDIEMTAYPFLVTALRLQTPRCEFPWRAAVHHRDDLARDLGLLVNYAGGKADTAHVLIRVSPASPVARSVLIEQDDPIARERLEQWRNDPATGNSPAILGALGRSYTKQGKIDDAQDVLGRYVKEAPERWAFEMLAANEQGRGDTKRWLEYLQEYLERAENNGLDHARIQVKIASHFMDQGQWSRARPYAETAAQTWAGWAMECAGRCNEGMAEFERAEYWFRNETERYPRSFFQWFEFCVRSMHGDLAAATQHAESFVTQAGPNLTENGKRLAVLLYDAADDPAQGAAFLKPLIETTHPTAGKPGGRFAPWLERMFLARFADSLDDSRLRDACWAQVAEGKDVPAEAAKVAALFREGVARKEGGPLDLKRLDAILEAAEGFPRSFLTYFAGSYLDRRNQVVDAARYWERCAHGIKGGASFVWVMGSTALRRRLEGKIPDDAHLYALRGLYHRREDRLDAARADLDKALKLDPNNERGLNYRAIVRRASGDYDGAVADFTRLIELLTDNASYRLSRAITRLLQGQDDAARDEIEQVLAADPRNSYGVVAKGLWLMAQGKRTEAEALFDQALKLDPGIGTDLERFKKSVRQERG